MYTIRTTGAAVTGARHLRAARNGQDAVATVAGDGVGAIVVCDGCGSGASSEVGARLGARLVVNAIAGQLMRGAAPGELWPAVRAEVTAALAQLVGALVPPGASDAERAAVVHDHLLFTIVAAAAAGDDASVWAIGDGGYAIGDRVHALGPFDGNQPPYLGYDVLAGEHALAPAVPHVAHASRRDGAIVVATDGAIEVGLTALGDARDSAHPDALRRRLSVLARGGERIDWDARRVVRTPAALQDDGAVAVLAWRAS
jgi:hypothetical protein